LTKGSDKDQPINAKTYKKDNIASSKIDKFIKKRDNESTYSLAKLYNEDL
jgi:hypothetical protein